MFRTTSWHPARLAETESKYKSPDREFCHLETSLSIDSKKDIFAYKKVAISREKCKITECIYVMYICIYIYIFICAYVSYSLYIYIYINLLGIRKDLIMAVAKTVANTFTKTPMTRICDWRRNRDTHPRQHPRVYTSSRRSLRRYSRMSLRKTFRKYNII